ncbi:MAG: hypothetical protein CVU45_05655 [Chloroflexi bacterium HGW-Chloroflexi-7]|nr:MAG: hypothetical protein CVU45_05655 [Chloroflexi bacterium HGW-Chloroflexi-7]
MSDVLHKKFYELNLADRLTQLSRESGVPLDELKVLSGNGGLSADQADHMVENAVGVFGLPLGVARNFLVNGREVLVPMAVEEPSVIAGASFMAKLAHQGGGLGGHTGLAEVTGQALFQVFGCQASDIAPGN